MSAARESITMRKHSGFTLVEMAVVLIIVGLLLGSMLTPLSARIEHQRIAETDRYLDQVKEALLGFAVANKRLPCPATAASLGAESFAAGGSALTGACDVQSGFLPASALGLAPLDSEGFMVDAWRTSAHRVRYAVYLGTINGVPFALTKKDGMRSATMGAIAAEPALLVVCSDVVSAAALACDSGPATSVPFIVFSVGKDASDSGVHQGANRDQNAYFVSHALSSSTANSFDDQLTWSGTHLLLGRMLAAGVLP